MRKKRRELKTILTGKKAEKIDRKWIRIKKKRFQ
jgi:hypothetical protein